MRGSYTVTGLTDDYQLLSLPAGGSGKQGGLTITASDEGKTTICTRVDGNKYAVITGTNSMKLTFTGDDMNTRGIVNNIQIHVRLHDAYKPVVYSAAPLALTEYKAGEKAYITIYYDEPLKSISGEPKLKLNLDYLGKYFQNPVYVDHGAGTNALVFEVTAKNKITVDDVLNKINVYLVSTNATKVGTVTATVSDYCNNWAPKEP